MRTIFGLVLSAALLTFCGGDSDDDTPPPPANTNSVGSQPVPTQPSAPPGQVMVTVVANSTPPGATVTGGGRQLGTTPLQTQVPVPAPQPGQTQTFAFTFQLAGYQAATINASPINNAITITAALAPAVAPTPVGVGDEAEDGVPGGSGRQVTASGRGGGPIFDNHTTTGTAEVSESCTIDTLRVRLNGTHSFFGDLHITLRGPDGRSYSLARGGRQNPFRTHTVRRASGRQARGRWTLSIADRLQADSGVLRGWGLSMSCRD